MGHQTSPPTPARLAHPVDTLASAQAPEARALAGASPGGDRS